MGPACGPLLAVKTNCTSESLVDAVYDSTIYRAPREEGQTLSLVHVCMCLLVQKVVCDQTDGKCGFPDTTTAQNNLRYVMIS